MDSDTTTQARQSASGGPPAAKRLSAWLKGYRPLPGVQDELFDAAGRPRDAWIAFLGEFASHAEGAFGLASRHLRDTGAPRRTYGEDNEQTWPLDPLPLILSQDEWAHIAAGVEQRAKLLEAVLQDVYGEGRLVADGALPAAVLTGSPDYLRAMRGSQPADNPYLNLYAVDLGRGPDGRWWVLNDHTQSPSGVGYALQNRLVVSRAFPQLYNTMNVHRLAPFFDAFRRGLSAAADRSEPRICLLSPGPFSRTYFEQAHLARYLGFLLVEGDDLVARDGKVYVRTIAGLKRADVIWRHVDADLLDPLELNTSSRLGTPGMLEAIREGGVVVMNMPGSGMMESRALMGFLPQLSRRLLGEDLKLPNIATWWCGSPAERAHVEAHLDDLIIAPAFNGPSPDGLLPGPRLAADLSTSERAEVLRRFRDRPGDYVGQDVTHLSTMPVLRNGALEPAPFVLRVFAAATPEGVKVLPGGFCRMSDGGDVRAISMGDGARAADVWIIDDKPVERLTLIPSRDDVKVRRILGHLPSRAADNLFWLGRYIERAEATLRLVRSLCTSLTDADAASATEDQTLGALRRLLVEWGALGETAMTSSVLAAVQDSLHDVAAWGSVIALIHSARRTASGMRERLSPDFWALLLELEADMGSGETLTSEAQALRQIEDALQHLAGLSGLAQENMNRVAGWRFLDIGRRVERGVNICRFTRMLAHDKATLDDLDLLLDLADSQITYRARYLVGLALTPVRDLVMLDPYNTRSLAFQVAALKEHLAVLPTLQDDGMLEEPSRILLPLATEVETEDAKRLDADKAHRWERALMRASSAIADRFFLQGATAVPTIKLVGLA